MKELVSRLSVKRTVFFGQADSFTVMTEGTDPAVMMRQLRIASLLYDHVIFAAAYMWQSRVVESQLPFLEELIRAGEILPAVRAPGITRDVVDYFDKRADETSRLLEEPLYRIPALASEVAVPSQRPIAQTLDRLGTRVHLDSGSVEHEYRKLWVSDCGDDRDPFSVYNTVSSSATPELVCRVLLEIALRQSFSRSVVAGAVHELSLAPSVKSGLISRASGLYLLANARACGSDLLATAPTLGSRGSAGARMIGPLAFANIDLFARVLVACGIPERVLHSLSDEELLALKYSDEFVAFRETYDRLVSSAVAEKGNFTEEVWSRFNRTRRTDSVKRKFLKVLGYTEKGSAALFSAALGAVVQQVTTTGQLVLVGGGLGAALSRTLKGMDRLNRHPVDDLVHYVTEGEYRRLLQRHRRMLD